MNNPKKLHDAFVSKVAQKYKNDGYRVYVEPEPSSLPFDLGLYRPDLVAMKSENDGYIVEIKNKSRYASVGRLREIAETVVQHDGWRFLLVTGDDVLSNEAKQQSQEYLLSWEHILTRKERGEKFLSQGEFEGAFLMLWRVVEAMMRKQAEQVSIPIERFPTLSLIKHLYSQGELSIEQFDKTMELLNVRNQFIHGFQSQDLDEAVTELQKLVSELVGLWYPQ